MVTYKNDCTDYADHTDHIPTAFEIGIQVSLRFRIASPTDLADLRNERLLLPLDCQCRRCDPQHSS
jgi:hypothetical protein